MRNERMEAPSVRCSTFSSVSIFPLSRQAETRVHTRAHACRSNNNGHWPTASLPEYSKAEPMIQSDNGPFVRTILWSNVLSTANGEQGRGWRWGRLLQNRGGMDPLRPLCVPLSTLKAWVAERNTAFHFPLAFSFENALAPLRFLSCLSLSLFLWKFARFWVWIDPVGEGKRERLRMIYVAWPDGNSVQERCGPFSCFGASSTFGYAFVIVSSLF